MTSKTSSTRSAPSRQRLKTRAAHLAIAIEQPEGDPVDAYYTGRALADLTGVALYRTNDFKTARKPPRPALKRVTLAAGITPCGGCERRAAALNRWLVFTARGK